MPLSLTLPVNLPERKRDGCQPGFESRLTPGKTLPLSGLQCKCQPVQIIPEILSASGTAQLQDIHLDFPVIFQRIHLFRLHREIYAAFPPQTHQRPFTPVLDTDGSRQNQ